MADVVIKDPYKKSPIGTRVYYVNRLGQIMYGTVVAPEIYDWCIGNELWCHWDWSNRVAYMPVECCYSVVIDIGDLEDDL